MRNLSFYCGLYFVFTSNMDKVCKFCVRKWNNTFKKTYSFLVKFQVTKAMGHILFIDFFQIKIIFDLPHKKHYT